MPPEEELEAFHKDRREHVEGTILPGLKRRAAVLVDRYYLSTAAYLFPPHCRGAHLLSETRSTSSTGFPSSVSPT